MDHLRQVGRLFTGGARGLRAFHRRGELSRDPPALRRADGRRGLGTIGVDAAAAGEGRHGPAVDGRARRFRAARDARSQVPGAAPRGAERLVDDPRALRHGVAGLALSRRRPLSPQLPRPHRLPAAGFARQGHADGRHGLHGRGLLPRGRGHGLPRGRVQGPHRRPGARRHEARGLRRAAEHARGEGGGGKRPRRRRRDAQGQDLRDGGRGVERGPEEHLRPRGPRRLRGLRRGAGPAPEGRAAVQKFHARPHGRPGPRDPRRRAAPVDGRRGRPGTAPSTRRGKWSSCPCRRSSTRRSRPRATT